MSVEKAGRSMSGWGMLVLILVLIVLSIFGMVASSIGLGVGSSVAGNVLLLIASCVVFVVACIMCGGFFTVQPGQARVCVLFGQYKGTVRDEGFRWANPFYSKSLGMTSEGEEPGVEVSKSGLKLRRGTAPGHTHGSKISVRARTLNGERLKVNDKMGNPIEIATVVVWRVADTAKAVFDVDDYESYVSMVTETALRHVASIYAYDHMEDENEAENTITLRTNIEEVSEALQAELDRKLAVAGVKVEDARLTHLAYAPEIAQAMLRRQQAEAVIAARKKIVEGAVGMVNMAVDQLSSSGTIDLDEERKAVMASNLMVVLCGESEAQPVLNTSSLY